MKKLTTSVCLPIVYVHVQSQPVPIPLNGVHARLRHSEEKLDQELETIFKHHSLLNHPDVRTHTHTHLHFPDVEFSRFQYLFSCFEVCSIYTHTL